MTSLLLTLGLSFSSVKCQYWAMIILLVKYNTVDIYLREWMCLCLYKSATDFFRRKIDSKTYFLIQLFINEQISQGLTKKREKKL